jgi:putative FmdB family regulatory protein
MIYEYECKSCEITREAIRKMSERTDPIACLNCEGPMSQVITGGAGFKIGGAGVASPGYKHHGPKTKYGRGRPVGPLDSRSKAYEKNKDEKSSTYYAPGQGAWLAQDTDRRNEHNVKKDKHGL